MKRFPTSGGKVGRPASFNGRGRAGLVLGALAGLMLAATGHAFAQGPATAGESPASSASAQSAEPHDGKALYDHRCSVCHGASGMGTLLLSRRRPVALLEARDDLAAPYVVLAARQGIGNMPALPRGELSDEQLDAIAEYLAAGPHEAAQ